MNTVLWARVSSREQREGYSIDAQLRSMRDKAQKAGWRVVREFVVAESAKRGAERLAFNDMLRWVKANARRERIESILSHKLDRICRNMRDAVRLQELEDSCGVQLTFVDNQFGPGAAGLLSFNVMAAVAQYYSDNLRSEVLKGMDEKVRQGWPTGLAPYGYQNVADRNEPIQPHPERSRTVIRIFELYSRGDMTFQAVADRLVAEGHVFRKSQPRFHRTALSYVLNNRFYIGDIRHRGQSFPGKHRPLIDRATFVACQEVLQGKNRRNGTPQHALAGGLFRCAFCGQSLTGERVRRRLRQGGVREHLYYRCANNQRGHEHPTVRWKAEDLERAIIDDLASVRIPSPEIAAWFRTALGAAFADITSTQHTQSAALTKRQSELRSMQDRLLNAYLAATVDEATYTAKSSELRDQLARVQESLDALGTIDPTCAAAALAVFDWSQNAADTWRGSNNAVRREILESVCLNRTLSDVNLVTQKRKPFDVFVEGLDLKKSRGDRI
jgi:site-specific DNA recombinase